MVTQASVSINVPTTSFSKARGNAQFVSERLGGDAGQPALPVYSCSVLLPANADLSTVKFSIEGFEEQSVATNIDVSPATPPTTASEGIKGWPDGVRIVADKDVAVYESNALFPSSQVKILEIGQLSVFKLVTVEVFQYRYNPITKELFQMTAGSLKVDYAVEAAYRGEPSAIIPSEVVKQVRSKVVNFDEFGDQYAADFSLYAGNGLVIIIPEDVKSKLTKFDAFVKSKEEMGFKVKVLVDSEWGGGTGATAYKNIRKWLQDNYKTLGINYVILIGSVNVTTSKVPMHAFPNYAPSSWPYTDCDSEYGYQQLTGEYSSDKSCELIVGRIPDFTGVADIDKVLQRSIDYANTTEADGKWRFNALFGGPGYDASNLIATPLNKAYNEFIVPNTKWKARRVYGTKWGQQTGGDITHGSNNYTAFSGEWASKPFGLVSWGTHGAPTLAEDVMQSKNAPAVGSKYPSLVFCGSCTNAHSRTNNNLSWEMVKTCAIAAMAGTRETAIFEDMLASRIFVKDLVKDSMSIGRVLQDLNNVHCSGWYNRAPMCIYGDPTLSVYTFKGPIVSTTSTKTEPKAASFVAKNKAISYYLPSIYGNSNVEISLFNAQGKLVQTIANNAMKVGHGTIDLSKYSIAKGVYFCKINVGTYSNTIKFVMSK